MATTLAELQQPALTTRQGRRLLHVTISLWAIAIGADAGSTIVAVALQPHLTEINPVPAALVAALHPLLGHIGAHIAMVAVISSACYLLLVALQRMPRTRLIRCMTITLLVSAVIKIVVSIHNISLAMGFGMP
jgi:hypothetical protein